MNQLNRFGSVDGVPSLPDGFADVFTSSLVRVDGVGLHTVQGGAGRPLLLVGGWPQNWYAWRLVMPRLAEHFRVVAVDPRGVGRSGKPETGYDTGTVAAELVALMRALGHERFAMAGHDVGLWLGYAVAADHPGLVPDLPIFGPAAVNDRLWHFSFNRKHTINEQLVRGREDIYFGDQLRRKAVRPLPDDAVAYYVETLARDPEALRASFDYYRATDENIEQNVRRARSPLPMPVLGVAGDGGQGERLAAFLEPLAKDLESVILNDCGHFVPEEQPDEVAENFVRFFGQSTPDAAV